MKNNSKREELTEFLNSFIWTFKIGDNILYNLDVIFKLVEDHDKPNGRNYAKPISILCVSVIEAILVDFLERLDSATRHYPSKLGKRRKQIKEKLDSEKRDFQSTFLGEVYQYKRLRNFGYKELVEFYEKFDILGSKPDTYETLQKLGYFRNRVHIRNYFGNFERNESRTFSEERTQKTIDIMEDIFKYLSTNYPRP